MNIYTATVNDDFIDVTAASAFNAAQQVARRIGHASATHTLQHDEWGALDCDHMRMFITDRGASISIIKLHPEYMMGMGSLPIADAELEHMGQ